MRSRRGSTKRRPPAAPLCALLQSRPRRQRRSRGDAKAAFRAARLPPFPDVHANAPPSPRRVAEKEASLRAVEAYEAKKAEDRLRAQEEEEKKLLARRIGRAIGGGY